MTNTVSALENLNDYISVEEIIDSVFSKVLKMENRSGVTVVSCGTMIFESESGRRYECPSEIVIDSLKMVREGEYSDSTPLADWISSNMPGEESYVYTTISMDVERGVYK